jgi:hypothetical protein
MTWISIANSTLLIKLAQYSRLQVSFDACAHIAFTLWVSTSYIVLMAMNAQEPMM